jgi:hypothetical protein
MHSITDKNQGAVVYHASVYHGNQRAVAEYTRQITPVPREIHCPHCGSIIYSRRNKLCGVCSQSLPDQCLFSAHEAQRIGELLRVEQQRHRRWNEKEFRHALSAAMWIE